MFDGLLASFDKEDAHSLVHRITISNDPNGRLDDQLSSLPARPLPLLKGVQSLSLSHPAVAYLRPSIVFQLLVKGNIERES